MHIDWMQVAVILIGVLAPAAFLTLISNAAANWSRFKDRSPDAAFALEEAATFAVKAAEQLKLAGILTEAKKDYALKIAEEYLALKGIHVDLHLIDAAIEKAVYEAFTEYKRDHPEAA